MELNNFEKQIQQKLKNREIKPSANSWDRLDAMLSMEEKPKKKGFFWINIAASFIVLASIGYYFYSQNETFEPVKKESIIVDVEKRLESREDQIDNKEENHEVLVENDSKLEKINPIPTKKALRTSVINNTELTVNNQKVSIINQSEKNNQNHEVIVDLVKPNQKTQSTTPRYISPERLLAEVTNTKSKPKNSEKEIKRTRKGVSVNPNALISNAENEIYQSYRESALDKLNKNFNSIKTVLANRNYEE